jgi:hypothetical protein
MSVNFKTENLQKHKELSDKIRENLVAEGTLVKEKEPHLAYYDNLPEGVNQKQVEEIAKYNTKFVTAAHVAIGELASEVFVKDKTAQQVEAELGFFGKQDKINITVDRSKTYQNHLAENDADKEVTKHLVMKTTVTSQSVKGYGLKAVRESMSEEFQGLFKK